MAAYAALVSLMNIIDQIKHHPLPPISLNKDQVESLTENLTFLQEFLEHFPLHFSYSNEADPLEMRMADAAHAAEDVIESHIVDQILAAGSTSGVDLYEGLQKVIAEMDGIKREVKEMKKMGNSSINCSGSSLIAQSKTMVGFDDFLLEIMDKLTGSQPDRLIIPIVGMGGIGKTTLARNMYAQPLIKEHFDICAWVSVSPEYNMQEIVKVILYQVKQGRRDSSQKELGEELYKYLCGRRYLIVLDEMWSIETWDKIKLFFPNFRNGSRIVVTTRLLNLPFDQRIDSYSYSLEMKFLDEDKSWDLFLKTVFGSGGCPPELEEIGKKIVERSEGLPLSIVVIGGLLAKHQHTREYWEYTAENLSSVVNAEDDDKCLKILHMSYNQLPVYLKPCFLYMGVYSKDSTIRVSALIRLWVAEGFLKPISGKSLEEIAQYLKEIINRNLILIHKLGSTGSIKYCMMHDLVRDLCLREAQKQRFYFAGKHHTALKLPQTINIQRRIAILDNTSQEKILDALQSVSVARSLIWDIKGALPSNKCRLLRILSMFSKYSYGDGYLLESILQLVNLKHLAVRANSNSTFSSSIGLPWNLHSIIIHQYSGSAPIDIWNMPQLRHIMVHDLSLPDPPSGRDGFVLEKLQKLERVLNFECSEEVAKRILNIRKLDIKYPRPGMRPHHCLVNLERLHKLTSFRVSGILQHLITFPRSLTKLTLEYNLPQYCDDIMEKVGTLPLLQKLKLMYGKFKGRNWETVEGQFCSLKFLLIRACFLECWTTDSTHFPRLEHLALENLHTRLEIPSSLGEILTLKTIQLEYCSKYTVLSAKKIQDEQEEFGNENLHVRARILNINENKGLESLASPNFHFSSD